ncbi:hypothetical protein G7046_g7912 [Stylonectria norvegica]|nr:hypothetical protein G7046_g7912 [Stylonectria norvegica]
MPSQSSKQSGHSRNSTYTGGRKQSRSTTLDTWSTSTDPLENFLIAGTPSGRGRSQMTETLAAWDKTYQK